VNEINVEKTKVMRISRQPLPVKIMIDQKQLENVESFKYLGSISTNDGRCTCEIKCRIAMAKAAFNKKRTLFTSTLDLELRKNLVKCYVWIIAFYGAETWTLRAVGQKHLESFEMWCWRRMEKISWTDHVRNEDVLLRVKEQRNILYETRKQKANWIGHILRRNCLLQLVTEGKIQGGIEVTGRRRRKLLDDLKERRGYSHLKEEALDRTMWTARFGRGIGPVVRQTINPLKPELNPICYLLALLRAHYFLHVSRIRVKLLTFTLLMSYTYGAPILDVSRSHTTQHSR